MCSALSDSVEICGIPSPWKNEELWVPSDMSESDACKRGSVEDGARVDLSQLSVNVAALQCDGQYVKGLSIVPIDENEHLKPGWVAYTTGNSDDTLSMALLNVSRKVCILLLKSSHNGALKRVVSLCIFTMKCFIADYTVPCAVFSPYHCRHL